MTMMMMMMMMIMVTAPTRCRSCIILAARNDHNHGDRDDDDDDDDDDADQQHVSKMQSLPAIYEAIGADVVAARNKQISEITSRWDCKFPRKAEYSMATVKLVTIQADNPAANEYMKCPPPLQPRRKRERTPRRSLRYA